jgi:ATP-dependent DNA ligase
MCGLIRPAGDCARARVSVDVDAAVTDRWYSAATLRDLGVRLRELETSEASFVDARPIPRSTHWVRPELVAQIGFAEWTNDGRLRQPRFLGLRDDKRPPDVVRERPR